MNPQNPPDIENDSTPNGEKTKPPEPKIFKYIGETARSAHERGNEHLDDIRQLKPSSHLLKHLLDKHEEENFDDIDFRMEVIKFSRSAFERQIMESVIIQNRRMTDC